VVVSRRKAGKEMGLWDVMSGVLVCARAKMIRMFIQIVLACVDLLGLELKTRSAGEGFI